MKKLVMMSTVALASSFMIMPSYGISCKDLEQKPKLTGINVPGSESDTFRHELPTILYSRRKCDLLPGPRTRRKITLYVPPCEG